MAGEDRALNVAVPSPAPQRVSRRTWVKGAGLVLAALGTPALVGACDSGGSEVAPDATGEAAPARPAPPEADKVLNVFNWTAYIDDESNAPGTPPAGRTIPRFEAETGIAVNYQEFGSNDEMLAKVLGGGSDFDIVVPSDYVVAQLIARGALRKLDKGRVANFYDNQAESTKGLYYDPDNDYSVPWGIGNTGIGVSKDAVTVAVTDASIFDDAAYKGRMSILDDFRSTIALALFHLGLDPTTGNAADLDRAFGQLEVWKANATVTSDYQDSLGAGDLVVSHAYSGDVFQQAAETGRALDYVIPTQGADKYVDSMVVLAGAPHPGNAHLFMDFVYEPDVSAHLMTAIKYRNANAAAYDLLPAAIRDDPIVFPPKEIEERLAFIELDEATAALWMRRWEQFVNS